MFENYLKIKSKEFKKDKFQLTICNLCGLVESSSINVPVYKHCKIVKLNLLNLFKREDVKMKKVIVGGMLLPLVLMFSCGPKKYEGVRDELKKQYVEATPFKTLPEEVSGEVVTGIGSSVKRANPVLAREAAITSAQADLARKVEAKIESVWKRTMADWSEYKKEGADEAMSVEEMKTMQKVIVDQELRGPWQIQEFINKDDGTYWVRIILPASTVEKWLKQRMQSENLLRKYIIESQVKKVQEDLQKDLDNIKQKEKDDLQKVNSLTNQ